MRSLKEISTSHQVKSVSVFIGNAFELEGLVRQYSVLRSALNCPCFFVCDVVAPLEGQRARTIDDDARFVKLRPYALPSTILTSVALDEIPQRLETYFVNGLITEVRVFYQQGFAEFLGNLPIAAFAQAGRTINVQPAETESPGTAKAHPVPNKESTSAPPNASLRSSDEREALKAHLQAKFGRSSIPTTVIDFDGVVVAANKASHVMLGYEPGELIGIHVYDVADVDESDVDLQAMKMLAAGEDDYFTMPKCYFRKDGTPVYTEITVFLVRDSRGAPLYAVGQAMVMDDAEYPRLASDQSDSSSGGRRRFNIGFWEKDVATGKTYWDEEMLHLFGYRRHELSGSIEDWTRRLHPSDAVRVFRLVESYTDAGKDRFQYTYRIRLPNGLTRVILSEVDVIRGKDGKAIRIVGCNCDITYGVFMDINRNPDDSEIIRNQRFETVATLAGGIAHDFNNILMNLLANAEVGLLNLSNGWDCGRNLEDIRMNCIRGRDLISQLLDFANPRNEAHKTADIQQGVENAIQLLKQTIPDSVTIDNRIERSGIVVELNPSRLVQLFLNLITNAIHALEHGGTIEISISENRAAGENDAPSATIAVSDTGAGIPRDIEARIFEPFFTTKPFGKGNGLGLAIVKNIVDAAGGAIRVDSVAGSGATFTIRLPLATQSTKRTPSTAPTEAAARQTVSGHIVILDDEVSLVESTTPMLRAAGFEVTPFTSASEAITYIVDASERIDLLITDLAMPDLQGNEVSDLFHHLNESASTLIISGSHDAIRRVEYLGLEGAACLKKPFSHPELMDTINDLLGTG